jgi:hypothetical protein
MFDVGMRKVIDGGKHQGTVVTVITVFLATIHHGVDHITMQHSFLTSNQINKKSNAKKRAT